MPAIWTPASRAICALTLGTPDEVPTFELEFQLSEELFGYPLYDPALDPGLPQGLSARELEREAYDMADRFARVYGSKNAYDIGGAALSGDPEKDQKPGLDYCIIPVYAAEWRNPTHPYTVAFRRRLREHFGNTRLFGCHGDGTFSIPSGSDMYEFSYRIADEPEAMLADAERRANAAIEANVAVRCLQSEGTCLSACFNGQNCHCVGYCNRAISCSPAPRAFSSSPQPRYCPATTAPPAATAAKA